MKQCCQKKDGEGRNNDMSVWRGMGETCSTIIRGRKKSEAKVRTLGATVLASHIKFPDTHESGSHFGLTKTTTSDNFIPRSFCTFSLQHHSFLRPLTCSCAAHSATCLPSISRWPGGSWWKLDEWLHYARDHLKANSQQLSKSSTQAEYVHGLIAHLHDVGSQISHRSWLMVPQRKKAQSYPDKQFPQALSPSHLGSSPICRKPPVLAP